MQKLFDLILLQAAASRQLFCVYMQFGILHLNKKYEDTLGIQVFVRDKNGHYKYTKKGYAKLDDKYKIFNEEKMTTFMNMLLGGTNWLTMVFILVAKAGLIKKSNSICNVIVGV